MPLLLHHPLLAMVAMQLLPLLGQALMLVLAHLQPALPLLLLLLLLLAQLLLLKQLQMPASRARYHQQCSSSCSKLSS
jgi:hypothetical protein